MIWATGDCHGNFQRFGMKHFPEQKKMTRDDCIIVCGDFGYWAALRATIFRTVFWIRRPQALKKNTGSSAG